MSIGTSDGKYFDNEFDFHADHFGLTTQETKIQVAGDFPARDKTPEAAPVTPPSNPRVPSNTGNEIILDKGETVKGAVFGEDNEWHVKRGDRWFKITPSQGPRKPAGTLSDASPDPVQTGQQFAADVRKDPSMLGDRTGFPSGGGGFSIKETISSPAVRYQGKTYTGSSHLDAIDNSPIKKLKGSDFNSALDKTSDGFITSSGRFISREEVMTIAKQSDQIMPSRMSERDYLVSEDIKH